MGVFVLFAATFSLLSGHHLVVNGAEYRAKEYAKELVMPMKASHNSPHFCSAVKVAPTVVVTAAHCVLDSYGKLLPFAPVVGNQQAIQPIHINPNFDLAIIRVAPPEEESYLENNFKVREDEPAAELIACGFPGGPAGSGPILRCNRLGPELGMYFNWVLAEGIVIPGMSGGVVIDLATNKLRGIISITIQGTRKSTGETVPMAGYVPMDILKPVMVNEGIIVEEAE